MSFVVSAIDGAAGRIRLERPAALNALNLQMFRDVDAALRAWRDDRRVGVVTASAIGKAFSAGGDIREVRDASLRGDLAQNAALYRVEYGINALIAEYPKPYVALVDGLCLGGGMGLVIHGAHRVVSERALLAMPETAIGFFPDIGCTYVLPRLSGAVGYYLGLTGYRLTPSDAIAVGLADAFVPSERFGALEAGLAAGDAPETAIAAHAEQPSEAPLRAHREAIARCFGRPSVAGILAALAAEGTAWADETLAVLRRMSPTALVTAHALFRRGAGLTLREALRMEERIAIRLCASSEFLEGVRAMVIDKDRQPAWSPATVAEVDAAAIARAVEEAAGTA